MEDVKASPVVINKAWHDLCKVKTTGEKAAAHGYSSHDVR